MELARGVPITEYCDQERLPLPQRIDLFVHVCEAVQHAHQKGIIHRDLKPTNVLVTLHDGTPVVKIIDFGIAKAMDRKLTDKTMSTQYAAMVGTPLYMSPEQAEMGGLDIDTRADIYALGVLLYELLTGVTPFDRARLQTVGIDEVRRIIHEEEPLKPSTRIDTLGESAASISTNRQSDPKHLRRHLRGELDWIVMKCLEKDRTRRYETASALVRDLGRYLLEEPVEARPPSAAYKLRKFVARNRGPVMAGALVLIALGTGIVGTTIGLVRAEEARQAAAQRAEGERLAKDAAEKRLAQIENGMDIIGSIFENLDPRAEETEGRSLRAILGDRLERAAAVLEGEVVGDPLVVARLQDRLGQTYLGLGQTAKAELLFTKALATRKGLLGADHQETLGSMRSQALAFRAAGNLSQAIKLLEQVRDTQAKKLEVHHLDALTTLYHLGVTYRQADRLPQAIALLEQVSNARTEFLGPEDPETLASLNSLAWAYHVADKSSEAVAVLEKVRDARVLRLGRDHPDTLATLDDLALVYRAVNKLPEAIATYEQARDERLRRFGPDDPRTLTTLNNLAWTYRTAGKAAEAIALYEQIRDRRIQKVEADNQDAFITLSDLAHAYMDSGNLEQAVSLLQRIADAIQKRNFTHKDAGRIVGRLCDCHERLNQFDKAEVWRRKWVAALKKETKAESGSYAEEMAMLGYNLLQQKKWVEADSVLRECLYIRQKKEPHHWLTFNIQSLLGSALLGQTNYVAAEPLLLDGYQGMKSRRDGMPEHARGNVTEALDRLVQLYDAWGKEAEADKWRKELEARKPRPES
jgi:tetratricopeptide (TPR) repeat protein